MAYCKHKKYASYKSEIDAWDKACQEFSTEKENWKYDFEKEYSKSDREQSILSQLIFIKLFCNDENFGNAKMSKDGISISISKNEIKKNFLFDIMNNPNKYHQPYIQANFSNKEYGDMKFKEIYHTIGNFAPVPRSIISKNYGPNLQLIHNNLNELWPWFLKFLKDNWNEFPTKIYELMSFDEYIHYSCQQMYYAEVFAEVYEMKKNGKEWDEIFLKLSIVDCSKCYKLLSFNSLFETNEICEIDERIKFLIELRGRYILFILNNK